MLKKMLTGLFVITAIAGLSNFAASQTAKAESVKLLELTLPAHPYVGVEEQLAMLPKAKEMAEANKKDQIESFDCALDANKKLTPGQKSFVKANYGKLGMMIDKQIADQEKARLPVEKWVAASLTQSYGANFTNAELTNLITFFQSPAGKQVLKVVGDEALSAAIVQGGGQPLSRCTKDDLAARAKFAAAPLGIKFLNAYIKDTNANVDAKKGGVFGGYQDSPMMVVLAPANLNNLFNQFVKDNYKQ